jgi:hypothetical protein
MFVGSFADCAATLFLELKLMRHSAEKKAETIRINVVLPSDAMGEQRLQLTVASMHGILPLGVSVLFLNGGFIQSKTNHLRT